MRKNLGTIIVLCALLVVGIIGGTFAYFQSSATFVNPFETAGYATDIYEIFNPDDGDELTPGAEVNKDVHVENSGDVALLVRINYAEAGALVGNMNWTFADGSTWTNGTYNAVSGSKWVLAADGYFYYTEIVPADGSVQHLDAVQLDAGYVAEETTEYYYTVAGATDTKVPFAEYTNAADALAAYTETQKAGYICNKDGDALDSTGTVTTNPDEYVWYERIGIKSSAGKAEYTLTATVETVQATEIVDADLTGVWGNDIPQAVLDLIPIS